MSWCRVAVQRNPDCSPDRVSARQSYATAMGELVDFDRHAHPPPKRPERRTEADGMYSLSDRNVFGQEAHRKRLAAALRARLYPNTALHPKQLAGGIGVSVDTVLNWAGGSSDPSSWKIGLLFAFFGADFWADVYGPIGMAMHSRYHDRVAADHARHAREAESLRMLMSGDGR